MKNLLQLKRLCNNAAILFTFIILTLPCGKAFSQCYSPPGDTTVYGDHEWNVYAFNTGIAYGDPYSWNYDYSGYYVDSSLSFDTQTMWPDWASPAYAPGYNGCAVNTDDHSWSAKRRGFECGIYQIDIVNHDDDGQLFVNGVKVWEHIGCCDQHINVWTGALYDTSTVIFRVAEGGGGSVGSIRFTPKAFTPLGPSTICPGYTLQLEGAPANSYLWSTGETTQTISVTDAGSYSLSAAIDGCTLIDSVHINVAAIDTPVLTPPASGFVYCPLGGATATISNHDPSLSYNWNSPDANVNGGDASFDSTGDYTLTSSDALGCSASSHVTITTLTGESDFGDNVWKVNAYLIGDVNDFGYSWRPEHYSGYYIDSSLNFNSQNKWDENSNPSTAPNYQGCPSQDEVMSWSAKRSGFPSGIYQIDVLRHDDEGQLFIDGVKVWEELLYSTDTTLNVWTGILGTSSQVEFRVTEGWGASNGALNFTSLDTTFPITVSGNQFVCTGQFYTLTSTFSGASYLWSNGETTDAIHAAQSGMYSLAVTGANGFTRTSDTVSITILADAAPVALITASSNTICNWNAVTLSSDNTDGNMWSTNEATQSINVGTEGNYTLTVSNVVGCFDQTAITIGRSLTPPSPIAVSPVSICENAAANLTASGLAPGGAVATFNGTDQYVEVTQNIPEYNFTIEMWVKTTAANTGIFCAKSYGIGAQQDRSLYLQNGQLYVFAIPFYGVTNTGFTINDGNWHHIALTVQTGAGKIVYVDGVSSGIIDTVDYSLFYWQTSFRMGSARDAASSDDQYFDGQIDNVRIWSEVRSQTDIRENMMLETPASSTNLVYQALLNGNLNATVGNNGDAPFGISYAAPDFYTYTWTGTGAPAPSTSETQTTSPLLASGDYTVTASAGSCSPSQSSSVSVIISSPVDYYVDGDGDGYGSSLADPFSSCSNPGAGYAANNSDCNDGYGSINPGVTEICSNGVDDNCNGQWDENCSLYTYYIDGDGDTYGDPADAIGSPNITPPVGYVSNSTDCNDVNAAIHPGATDLCNGIDDNCDGVVDENALQATLTPDGSVNVCKGTPLTLTANTVTGIEYIWFKNGKLISGASGNSYTVNKNGNYTVRESNLICSSISTTTSVTINALPSATITVAGSLDLCGSGSVLFTANSGIGLSYQWKKGVNNISGATNQNFTATTKATYKVVVTNSNGCSKTAAGVKVTRSCKSDLNEEKTFIATLNIYPNPAHGQFVIEMNLDSEEDEQAEIQIFNSLGQQVYSDRAEVSGGSLHKEVNSLSYLPVGNYFVRVIVNEKVFTEKIMIQ